MKNKQGIDFEAFSIINTEWNDLMMQGLVVTAGPTGGNEVTSNEFKIFQILTFHPIFNFFILRKWEDSWWNFVDLPATVNNYSAIV